MWEYLVVACCAAAVTGILLYCMDGGNFPIFLLFTVTTAAIATTALHHIAMEEQLTEIRSLIQQEAK